jgi:prepilin-type N-terminal cleavage/methylation domain-containing protein
MRTAAAPRRRAGFTLIELLVVISLILLIAALAAGYFIFSQDHANAVSGTDRMSGWLLNSKGRAKRDARPTGVRLLIDSATNNVSQLVYIQEPDDYGVEFAKGFFNGANAGDVQVAFTGVDFIGGASYPGEIDESTVQAGDYLELFGGGGVYQIAQVMDGATLKLASPIAVPLTATSNFRIIRQPRRLTSEDVLDLPASVIIDPAVSQNLPIRTLTDLPPGATQPRTQQVVEIVFAPSGAVVGQGTGGDKIILWLHDPKQQTPYGGSPLLVTVQIRTGFIAVQQVGPNGDPFRYTRDARSSGI